ncbi:uncharacterized protein LOC129745391 [Uranotaenia lowii]|uniref:uncharacterized protein LOC129745391 n=1 Tax=Uranotaenia lowii TaxID=190385 RepID=UPI0024792407|nr:uncharacterized protein LOC129745391 [Uranotaenia lowii]
MADQTELRMNLVAIQRSDPYAKDIVNSSAHVAFYTFNTENEWEKTDIEGALFIYRRSAEPYHSIFINNRLNTNSLVEPLNGQIELQVQPPFLLYRNERSRIRGFWFYNKSECERIRKIIDNIVADCKKNEKPKRPNTTEMHGQKQQPLQPQQPSNGTVIGGGTNVDIFSMLTKAQEDFNNSTGKQQLPVIPQQQQHQPPPVINQPVVPPKQEMPVLLNRNPSTAINIVADQGTPQSVVNFFAAAKQPAASEVPLFQTLMTNPVHTLEQIEKQHRATTPQKEGVPGTGKKTPEVIDLEHNFKMMGIPVSTGPAPELGTSPLATFLSSTNLAAVRSNAQPIPKTKPIEISELELRHQQQQPLHELLKKSESLNNSAGSTLNPTTPSSGKPALMPPTMFTPTTAGSASKGLNDLFANAAIKKDNANGSNNTSISGLLSKANSLNANNNNHQPPPGFFPMGGLAPVEPLTQAQLIQAISYLVKHDPDFVRKLHEAYLKSFQEMMAI